MLTIAGGADALAPAPAVRAVVDLLPNAASVRFETVPGSHLGALTGSTALETTWRYLDEFLAANDPVTSKAKAPPPDVPATGLEITA